MHSNYNYRCEITLSSNFFFKKNIKSFFNDFFVSNSTLTRTVTVTVQAAAAPVEEPGDYYYYENPK